MTTDANATYLAYAREMIADRERQIFEINEQMRILNGERIAIAKDLKGWQEIANLVADKTCPNSISPGSDDECTHEDYYRGAIRDDDEHQRSSRGSVADKIDFTGKTHAQTAAIALRALGRAATAAEIRDWLNAKKHQINEDAKLSANILYNSMGRQPHVFRKGDGGRWEIIQREAEHFFMKDDS